MLTYEQAKARALANFSAFVGRVIRPVEIVGYRGEWGESERIDAALRVSVRVVATGPNDITFDTGGFIDPFWNVEVVEDRDGLLTGLRSFWIDGRSVEYSEASPC